MKTRLTSGRSFMLNHSLTHATTPKQPSGLGINGSHEPLGPIETGGRGISQCSRQRPLGLLGGDNP